MNQPTAQTTELHDYIVIGSGFGGSVSAMRLAEKGYAVTVLEQGKHWAANDFPKTDWNIPKYFWLPALRFLGFQQLSLFKQVFVVSGVGVGGGSLVYANTHIMPDETFFKHPVWARFNDWASVLAPFYTLSRKMLGTTPYPHQHIEDEILKSVADDMGKGDTWQREEVGVYFGPTKTTTDPYFNGLGPQRAGCRLCAGCLLGCPYNAKNTLDKNYLWFAQKFGATIQAETRVTKIVFENGIYSIYTEKTTAFPFLNRLDVFNFFKTKTVLRTKGVVMSAGVLGTMELLLKQKHDYKTLPLISDRLGENFRTNSESVCSVALSDQKLNHGIALSSGFKPDANTHVEIFKYPDGSGAMGAMGTLATENAPLALRIFKLFLNIVQQPLQFLKLTFNRNFAANSIMLLVMQNLDTKFTMTWQQGLIAKIFGGSLKIKTNGTAVPPFIAVGQEVMHRYAAKVNGTAVNAATEILFNMSTTAHVLGGCTMGETSETGVIDANFKLHNYPNFYVLDGSVVQGNLGVNPALTITALSEYAMSLLPAKTGNTNIALQTQLADGKK
jgi:cholesterol oxidase